MVMKMCNNFVRKWGTKPPRLRNVPCLLCCAFLLFYRKFPTFPCWEYNFTFYIAPICDNIGNTVFLCDKSDFHDIILLNQVITTIWLSTLQNQLYQFSPLITFWLAYIIILSTDIIIVNVHIIKNIQFLII